MTDLQNFVKRMLAKRLDSMSHIRLLSSVLRNHMKAGWGELGGVVAVVVVGGGGGGYCSNNSTDISLCLCSCSETDLYNTAAVPIALFSHKKRDQLEKRCTFKISVNISPCFISCATLSLSAFPHNVE